MDKVNDSNFGSINIRPVLDRARLDRDDVLWMEVNHIPIHEPDDSYIASNMVIALCRSGQLHNLFDMRPVQFQPHDIAVMLPQHIVSQGKCTPDYAATLIVVSRRFYDELINRDSFCDFYKYRYYPCCHLNAAQYEKISAILHALKIVIESKSPKRLTMIANMLDVLFYTLSYYHEGNEVTRTSRHEILFQSFYDLLISHYSEHHEVAWYAGQLCLTPKHFSTVICKVTGKSAGEWIASVLNLQAKKLINTRKDLSMQEIADMLGFSGNASFCRFFRRLNGISPIEFKNM